MPHHHTNLFIAGVCCVLRVIFGAFDFVPFDTMRHQFIVTVDGLLCALYIYTMALGGRNGQ